MYECKTNDQIFSKNINEWWHLHQRRISTVELDARQHRVHRNHSLSHEFVVSSTVQSKDFALNHLNYKKIKNKIIEIILRVKFKQFQIENSLINHSM